MHHLGYIRYLSQYDGLPLQQQLQLNRIANELQREEDRNRGVVACTFDESLRVAYAVFKALRPAQVNH